jgi:hypothetical protein
MPYINPENVADYLNVDLTFEGEALSTDLITGSIAQIESACNRTWTVTNPVTESFDGGASRLFPNSLPVTVITSLTLDGAPMTADTDFYNYRSFIRLAYIPAYGHQRLVLTYTSGATVPEDVKRVLIRWVAEQLMQSTREAGNEKVKRLTQGPVTIDYGLPPATSMDPISGLPSYVEEVVRRYRLSPM